MATATALDEGLQLHRAGRLAEAEARYRSVLATEPNHADALHLLGVIALQVGRHPLAAELITRAIGVRPDVPAYHNNLGEVWRRQGRLDDAAAAFRRAIALQPGYAEAHGNLGNVLAEGGRAAEALAEFDAALALQPASAEAHCNRGELLKKLGRLDEAVAAQQAALRLQPDFAAAHSRLGGAHKDRGEITEAVACFRRAAELAPGHPTYASNLLLTLHYDAASTPQSLAEAHRQWRARLVLPKGAARPHPNPRDPERRLRIGYVSPNFCDHPIARFMLPLLRHHDRGAVEIICYAHVGRPDAWTARLRAAADAWRDLSPLDDDAAADLIRADGIDVLVDLALHSGGNRLPVFARRPAPVAATYLGYCSTTGLEEIDYRLTDPCFELEPADGSSHAEKHAVHLETYWCYAAPEEAAGADLAVPTGPVTLGSLNHPCKHSPTTLRLWGRILGALPGAKLLLHAHPGSHRERLVAELTAAAGRALDVEFVPRQTFAQYLATYGRIDLGLDPFPFCGGTTTCDALWMGVPVISLIGRTSVGRGGYSLLHHAGLAEFAVPDEEAYLRRAVELARDAAALRARRAEIRARFRGSPVMDAPRFARTLEAAYRGMWRRWCAAGS